MISFDAKSLSSTIAAASSISWAHTVGTLTNGAFVVGFGARDGASTHYVATGVTYNGDAMTVAVQSNNSGAGRLVNTEIWRLVNPDAGANNAVITFTSTVDTARAVGASFAGVDQASPVDSTDSATGIWEDETTPIVTHTTINNNAVVMAVAYDKNLLLVVGGSLTELYNAGVNGDGDSFVSAYVIKATAGDQVMEWTGGETAGEDWSIASIALKPAADATVIKDIIGVGVVPFLR